MQGLDVRLNEMESVIKRVENHAMEPRDSLILKLEEFFDTKLKKEAD
jgi:ribosome-binding protein aMBF1 (putative translation factor)